MLQRGRILRPVKYNYVMWRNLTIVLVILAAGTALFCLEQAAERAQARRALNQQISARAAQAEWLAQRWRREKHKQDEQRKTQHPPVDDPRFAAEVNATIKPQEIRVAELPRRKRRQHIAGKLVIVSNDDEDRVAYSWMNSRVPAGLRARTVSEISTIAFVRRLHDNVQVIAVPGSHVPHDQVIDILELTLIDRRRNAAAATESFRSFMRPMFERVPDDVALQKPLTEMIDFLKKVPQRGDHTR